MITQETVEVLMSDAADEYTVLAADIAGAHGVSGSLRVRLIGIAAERSLVEGRVVRASRASDSFVRDLTLLGLRKQTQPKGAWIARFKGVTDRLQAEALHGCSLLIKETERAALPEGEYYVDQLIGLPVVGDTGRSFGKLADVLTTPANDVYVTDDGTMIPAVADFLLSVDLEAKRIVVKDVPGLRDDV